MQELIRRITLGRHPSDRFDYFKAGDTINVHVRVKEGEKERIQQFKGTVIKVQGKGVSRSFTVRKMSYGVGVERTFPFSTPAISKVEVIAHGKVRRGRLYYLRQLRGKAANIESELAITRSSRKNNEKTRKNTTENKASVS